VAVHTWRFYLVRILGKLYWGVGSIYAENVLPGCFAEYPLQGEGNEGDYERCRIPRASSCRRKLPPRFCSEREKRR
jgi:hypothetical protein